MFGQVPGITDLPNPAGDLAGQIPGLAGLNSAASGTIGAKLGGSISPATMNALQNAAATYGLTSGMPGLPKNGLAMNRLFGNIAGFAENQAQQGLADYNSFIPTVSGTQTVNPALQASLSQSNAVNRSAPDPAAAGSHAEGLFNKYLNSLRAGGGGTRSGGGGVGGGGSGTDALGFPNDRFMSGGAGVGPGEVSANSLGTSITRSSPYGSGFDPIASGAAAWQPNDYGLGQDWLQNYGTGTPAGTVPANNQWSLGAEGGYGGAFTPGADSQQWMDDFLRNFDVGTDVGV